MVSAMSDDDKKAGGNCRRDRYPKAPRRIAIGKLTAHQKRERSCRWDSFAGSLGVPFQYQGNVADGKRENLNETTVVTLLRKIADGRGEPPQGESAKSVIRRPSRLHDAGAVLSGGFPRS
jgi:hypothetical protein